MGRKRNHSNGECDCGDVCCCQKSGRMPVGLMRFGCDDADIIVNQSADPLDNDGEDEFLCKNDSKKASRKHRIIKRNARCRRVLLQL